MRKLTLIFLVFLFSFSSCRKEPSFRFEESEQGLELLENGRPVFFYQRMPKSLDGRYVCSNYLHPLYSLDGDTLTEEFPADHPHHRGVFWAWHQMYVDGRSVGDGWVMQDIAVEVKDVRTGIYQSAVLDINAVWKSALYENNGAFLGERTVIRIHPLQQDIRMIDFAITLQALVPGVEIGGADDDKGYGGFCIRIKLPEDISFISGNQPVTPQRTQIEAGPWMDFSADFGRSGKTSGIAILCHPETPNYPESWILRAEKSMQNVVYPGRQPVQIPTGKPVTLYYQLVIHRGDAASINLDDLQTEYADSDVTDIATR